METNLKKIALAVFLHTFLILSKHSYAASEQFSTEYITHYDFQESGEAFITQEINITNLKSDVIASNYALSLKQMDVYSVDATVNGKTVEPNKSTENEETTIAVEINNYVIGEGRQNNILLTYKTKDLATKVGEIWNINIPRTDFSSSTSFYNVQVSIPEAYGPLIYMSPHAINEKHENAKYSYFLGRENLVNKGISASFGKYQMVNFQIRYQIENPRIIPGIYEIALPSDIPQVQQVQYAKLDPKPINITIDEDGNGMARYRLKPNEKLEILLTGKARIKGRQINPEYGGSFANIPKEFTKNYTKEQPYWETSSREIQTIALELKDHTKNVTKNAQKVYEYVVNNIEYDFEAIEKGVVERHGAAAAAISKGPWACMEYTDLFIAICRAMGIPAREINGYAFSTAESNKPISIKLAGGDLLHAWAEFYDPFYGWVQVDPTWGNTAGIDYFTKLDTNHFAFVVRGKESEYPLPAGVYRFQEEGKLVDVEFATDTEPEGFEEKLYLKEKRNFNLIQIFKGNKKYTLKNDGNVFVYNINNTERNLPPDQEMTIYLPKKGQKQVRFESFNGEVKEKKLAVVE